MTELSSPDLIIEPLAAYHNRTNFFCGEASLDRYFKTLAMQDVKRKVNGVFVLINSIHPVEVLGYYTLCATALNQGQVPSAARQHIPRYPLVSATLLGRLAVTLDKQKQGLGSLLLADAIQRTFISASSIGSCMLVVDAISVQASAFYKAFGFVQLPDSKRLIMPMQLIAKLRKNA